MSVAAPNCCEEAMMGFSIYVPCNRPATKVVGWKGRSDKPVRMCDFCADHNTRNRGGFVVKPFEPPKPPLRTDYTERQITDCAGKLSNKHLDVLYAATTNLNYAGLAERLNLPIGTIKSRLSRARVAMAKLIEGKV